MTSIATNKPVSDKVIRERTFEVTGSREDKKDIQGVIALTIQQLMEAKTTGQVILNFNQGHVASMILKESRRT